MHLPVYDEDDQRYVPLLVSLSVVAIALAVVLAAVITLLLTREAQPPTLAGFGAPEGAVAQRDSTTTGPLGTPSVPPSTPDASREQGSFGSAGPTAACLEALRQADALSESSAGVGSALSAHTKIMDELLAQRLNTNQALDQTLPVLTEGAKARSSLDDVIRSYRQARTACQD